ncbi:MAG: protein-L-isoaspartate O-methyltransferase family protein [Candidatus Eutrophobiaceae bacterium]
MNIEQARFNMIEQQIRTWDVFDQKTLDLLMELRREDFLPDQCSNLAFADTSLPIGHGQFTLPPKMEGRLLQNLTIEPNDTVLEVGTGCGYTTALLAKRAKHVTSLDVFPEFTVAARAKCASWKLDNIHLETANIFTWDNPQRFNAILFTGSVSHIREEWIEKLNDEGRLIAIVGKKPVMEVQLISRFKGNRHSTETLFETLVPPLIAVDTESDAFEF